MTALTPAAAKQLMCHMDKNGCCADQCMMWRWDPALAAKAYRYGDLNPVEMGPKRITGYCILAGGPHFD